MRHQRSESEQDNWRQFVRSVCNRDVPEHFRRVQLSQACLESGRGTSELFVHHVNPYGMKWREALKGIAAPIKYRDDTWCKFNTPSAAAIAYWHFLDRPVYKGWRDCPDSVSMLRHLIKCGYASDPQYFEKVTSFFDEVNHIFRLL